MRCRSLTLQFLALWVWGVASLSGVQAAGPGTTSSGVDPVSGGVGQDERRAMQDQQRQYSFWLTSAIRRSGTCLSGVRVRIVDAGSRKSVLEHSLDGPWLFAALPPGCHEIEASYRESDASPEQTIRKITNLRPGEHHQMMAYFEGNDEAGSGNGPSRTPKRKNGEK